MIPPQLKEHRALEHEHVAVVGSAQAVKQAFQGISGEDESLVMSATPGRAA